MFAAVLCSRYVREIFGGGGRSGAHSANLIRINNNGFNLGYFCDADETDVNVPRS